MLNYVWMTLLFLGIITALTTDIVNQSNNKYKNNEALPVAISFTKAFDPAVEKSYYANLTISKKDFNSLYEEDISSDFSIPAEIAVNPNAGKISVLLKTNKATPEIWKEIAPMSGEENDLSGSIYALSLISEREATAEIILEEVLFLKMKEVTNSTLEYAKISVNIALGLIGIMALWLGVMKIAEEAGLIAIIANWLRPITKRLFPDVPSDHPAMGSMIMNISANMLGLGNAATPFGLKAMEDLDKLNPNKGTATNAMVTFLAINTAGMTLIPATAIAVRAAAGSSDPAIIIGTSLFGAFCATVIGVSAAKILEKFPLQQGSLSGLVKKNKKGILIFAGSFAVALLLILTGLGKLIVSTFAFINLEILKSVIEIVSTVAIPLLIFIFVGFGVYKKVKIYEQFIEGAKEGFNIAVRIIPYLVAILVAIGIFRAGGAMDWLIKGLEPITNFIGMPAEALPMALMRPLSGSGSLGVMTEIISVHGPDSFIGILVSTFFGSTETTFYVLAVYFGAVNIKKTRHAIAAGLLADVAGILGALFIVKLLFG
jgi:spore maturation protein SpmA